MTMESTDKVTFVLSYLVLMVAELPVHHLKYHSSIVIGAPLLLLLRASMPVAARVNGWRRHSNCSGSQMLF